MSPEAGASAVTVKQLGVAWGGWSISAVLTSFGFHTWGDFAGFAAGVLSIAMLGRNLWQWYREWKAAR